MAHEYSIWPIIETAKVIVPKDSDLYVNFLTTRNGKTRTKQDFFKVKYQNPKNLVLQQMAVNEYVFNETKNKYERVNRFRNGDKAQHLTSIDIEEIVKGWRCC